MATEGAGARNPRADYARGCRLEQPFRLSSPAFELDHIVMMVLRKKPQRRYQSVEQFSADIRRYLENLPQTRGVQPPTYLPDGVRTQRLPLT